MNKETLNLKEASELLLIHPDTLRNKAGGEIPGFKVGRRWVFVKRQLLEWLENKSQTRHPKTSPYAGRYPRPPRQKR